ncbi:MAG: acyltransferase domain-containing protein [Candidatus Sumerlaeia bacterium]|nr:acyltransferase domain-containing protein [Candidatus Sumerlaeia bacterium]
MDLQPPIAFLYPPQPLEPCATPEEFFRRVPRLQAFHGEALDALGWDIGRKRAAAQLWPVHPKTAEELCTAHVGVAAFSWALTQWLAENGVAPDVVFGHSLGLHMALAASGAVPVTDALEVVERTARFLAEPAGPPEGAMLAVTGFSPEEIQALCAEYTAPQTAYPAIINSRRQVVVSGTVASIEILAAELRRRLPWGLTLIPSRLPLHCLLMMPLGGRCAELVAGMHCHVPRRRLVHPSTGEWVRTVSAVERLWRTHLLAPIDFVGAMEQMERLGAATYIEVGAGQTLSRLCRWFRRDIHVVSLGEPGALEALRAAAG